MQILVIEENERDAINARLFQDLENTNEIKVYGLTVEKEQEDRNTGICLKSEVGQLITSLIFTEEEIKGYEGNGFMEAVGNAMMSSIQEYYGIKALVLVHLNTDSSKKYDYKYAEAAINHIASGFVSMGGWFDISEEELQEIFENTYDALMDHVPLSSLLRHPFQDTDTCMLYWDIGERIKNHLEKES